MAININYETLKAKGTSMVSKAEAIEANLNAISALMDEVGGTAWNSPYARKLKEEYNEISSVFPKVKEAITEMGSRIEATGKAFEANEGING